MQELIKEIEDAQIKEVTPFNVGDTIKVHAKIVEGETGWKQQSYFHSKKEFKRYWCRKNLAFILTKHC